MQIETTEQVNLLLWLSFRYTVIIFNTVLNKYTELDP